jgi:hypothetical protein
MAPDIHSGLEQCLLCSRSSPGKTYILYTLHFLHSALHYILLGTDQAGELGEKLYQPPLINLNLVSQNVVVSSCSQQFNKRQINDSN